ncbi:SH3 domain-containing protein [Streptomyces sp. NPDC050418]|uniref:SH3 domain-containing protein n=1 Tax=Streptomyces sp. NPDC050418 TaxID=3365612 RepID=UPI0037B13433
MSLRSTTLRLGISATAVALTATAALTTTATASHASHASHMSHASHAEAQAPTPRTAPDRNDPPPIYKGRVNARNGLLLRDSPTRGSRIVRTEPYGAYVHIFCKTRGESVENNDRWYLLTDGTWAWGAAAFIDNIGPAPRWC